MGCKHITSPNNLKRCPSCAHKWCLACEHSLQCPVCKTVGEYVHQFKSKRQHAKLKDHIESRKKQSKTSRTSSDDDVRISRGSRLSGNFAGRAGSKSDDIFSALVGVGLIGALFFIFLGGFIPAIIISIAFFYADKIYLSGKETESQGLAHGWCALALLSLYIAGFFVVKKVLFTMDSNGMFDSFSTYKKIGSWDAMFGTFYFCAFPMISMYLLTISNHLSEVNGQPKSSAKVTFKRRIYITVVTILTLSLYHPWVSFKKKKGIWFVASILHVFVPLLSIIVLSKAGIESRTFARDAVEWSFIISLVLSIIHVNWFQSEYLSTSQSQIDDQVDGQSKCEDAYDQNNETSNEQEVPDGTFKKSKDKNTESPNWNSTDPFEILGITAEASQSEKKEAYHNLIAQYHPDKVATLGPEFQKLAEEKSKIINWAYNECSKRTAV